MTVNTVGLPMYARQIEALDASAINVKTEGSILPVNKRPRLAVKILTKRLKFPPSRGPQYLPDQDGVELSSKEIAWSEAIRASGEMLRDIDTAMPVSTGWHMDVFGKSEPVFTLRFVGFDHALNVAKNPTETLPPSRGKTDTAATGRRTEEERCTLPSFIPISPAARPQPLRTGPADKEFRTEP